LLTLSENAQKNLRDGKISPGHARALLAFVDPAESEGMRKQILDKKLSVREVEALAYEAKAKLAKTAQAMTDAEQNISGGIREAVEISLDGPEGLTAEPAVTLSGNLGANAAGAIAPQADREWLETSRSAAEKGERDKKPQSATLMQLQHKLSLAVKLPVKISGRADRGRLSISYSTQAELAYLLSKLGVEENFD
jgi:ParB-like chromosome segregation protein Spo0J